MADAGKKRTGPGARDRELDMTAVVTRSLLGYGVIAGPIYVVVGLVQAILRDGFDLSRHSLSLLANGSWGWVQVVNFVVVGLMVLAAALGTVRAMAPSRGGGALVGLYGLCLIVAGVFRADAMDGFPPGTPDGAPEEATAAGIVHLVAGGLGFLALAVAFVLIGRWFATRGDQALSARSRIAAVVVLVASVIGGATATSSLGVALLWVAVLVGWAWLAVLSVALYKTVPHPELHRR